MTFVYGSGQVFSHRMACPFLTLARTTSTNLPIARAVFEELYYMASIECVNIQPSIILIYLNKQNNGKDVASHSLSYTQKWSCF